MELRERLFFNDSHTFQIDLLLLRLLLNKI